MKKFWHDIKGILLLLAIFLAVLSIDIAAVSWYYNYVKDFIEHQPKNIQADAGVIFFGDYKETGNYIELGPDTRNRANEAIRLFNSDKIKHIICVGGYSTKVWSGKPHLLRNNYSNVVAISAPLHIYRISRMIRSDSVTYSCYKYRMSQFKDYKNLFKIVHREWLSHFLNFALNDDARNTLVFVYRTTYREIKDLLQGR